MQNNNVVAGVLTEAACEREEERIGAKLHLFVFNQEGSPSITVLRGNWITYLQRLSKENPTLDIVKLAIAFQYLFWTFKPQCTANAHPFQAFRKHKTLL